MNETEYLESVAFRLASWLVAYRCYEPPTRPVTWSESHNEIVRELVDAAKAIEKERADD